MPTELNDTQKIQKVKEIIDELEDISDEVVRAKERFDMTLIALDDLGCSSIEAAEKEIKTLLKKVDKKNNKLQEDFDDFIDDYGDTLE